MATEIPHKHTLVVTLFIGTEQDLTSGMTQLAKKFPGHIKASNTGWVVTNISHSFLEDVKDTFIEDKIKLTERFELNLTSYLSWVISRRFITLELSVEEPIHHIKATPWEWKKPAVKSVKNEATSDNS